MKRNKFYLLTLFILIVQFWIPSSIRAAVPESHPDYLKQIDADTTEYPYSYSGRVELGRALAEAGKSTEALELYSELLEEYPGDPDLLLLRALVHTWSGNYDAAESDLREAIEAGDDYADHWHLLGNVKFYSGRSQAALSAYNRALEQDPERGDIYLARARLLIAENNLEEAFTDLEAARELSADETEVQRLLLQLEHRWSLEREFGARNWLLTTSYDYVDVDGRDSWRAYQLLASRRFEKGSLNLELRREKRFGDYQNAYGVTGYFTELWTGAWGSLGYYSSSRSDDYLPDHDLRVEFHQNVVDDLFGLLSYRRLEFSETEVDIYGTGFEYYYKNWFGRLKLDYSRADSGGLLSQLMLRNYYQGDGDNYLEISGSYGKGRRQDQFVEEKVSLDSHSVGFAWQTYLTQQQGLKLSYEQVVYDDEPDRRTYSFGFNYRF